MKLLAVLGGRGEGGGLAGWVGGVGGLVGGVGWRWVERKGLGVVWLLRTLPRGIVEALAVR